ncbi:PRC-barrel domain containing protein [Erythrobacteraceae bacterium CFH 75059]|uniref:PRC-barrel domain containing protein n=1 Tax=Qipengyuania thermophila TaxID=2509361 RepID=UPI001021660D|nr:PRC-barrel domain containing protein [Qipengyuania thermophila]TCD06550.1 PRC-barrel domain containing protein [Erythrobacteraceae bacterium CFH 75059]
MRLRLLPVLFTAPLALAACNQNSGTTATTEGQTAVATAPAAAPGQPAGTVAAGDIVALGLTERQLLDADLIDPSGRDIGDVEGVLRNASGQVDRLLVEVENTSPDRYVHVPIDGLAVVQRGDDIDLSTSMTQQQLAALPAVDRNAR